MKSNPATQCAKMQQKIALAPPLIDIAAQKQQALLQLLEGHSVTKTAEAVGIDRSTLHRWLREPKFIAERNHLVKESRDAARSRLHSLIGKAAEVVENRIKAGDLKAALAVLKMTGLAAGEKVDEETDERKLISRRANLLAESFWETLLMGEPAKNLYKNPRFVETVRDFYTELEKKYRPEISEAEELIDEIAQRDYAAAEAHRKIVKSIESRQHSALGHKTSG